MRLHNIKHGLGILLLALSTANYANIPGPGPDKPDNNKILADSCRQIALKLDWLGRYQDRVSCTTHLDGASVYIASEYILNNEKKEASLLIQKAIVLTNFAIDIGCYGREDMQTIVANLSKIQSAIA